MAESPFDKFPASFKPLFEKLPPPDEDGLTVLEGNWWRRDRDEIACLIAQLGRRLQPIEDGWRKARDANDLDATRGGVLLALQKMRETLLEIYSTEALWPLSVAIEAMEHAGRRKRYWLTALPGDELHIRQDAPKRIILQAMAAATVEYFHGKISGRSQAEIAASIAEAMGTGGFYVARTKSGTLQSPSSRTIQHWRSLYQPGKRPGHRPPSQQARKAYKGILAQLKKAGERQSPAALFDRWLLDITKFCRDAKEIRK